MFQFLPGWPCRSPEREPFPSQRRPPEDTDLSVLRERGPYSAHPGHLPARLRLRAEPQQLADPCEEAAHGATLLPAWRSARARAARFDARPRANDPGDYRQQAAVSLVGPPAQAFPLRRRAYSAHRSGSFRPIGVRLTRGNRRSAPHRLWPPAERSSSSVASHWRGRRFVSFGRQGSGGFKVAPDGSSLFGLAVAKRHRAPRSFA